MRLVLPPLSFKSPRAVGAAILTLGGLASYVVNFPGSLEDDSFAQLLEGRTESYSFWHPPVMSWMLGISDAIMPGAAVFVLFDTVLAFGAIVSLLWLPRRVSWIAVAAAAVFVCLPQLFLFQAIVWKDALFADACLAAYVCLAHAAARWPMRRLRLALIGGAAFFLALAMLARQNGVLIVPCAVLALGAIAAGQEKQWRIGAVYAAALLVASTAMAMAANAALALRSDGTPAAEEQFKLLQLYDLTGMVKARPDLRMDVLDKESPRLARLIRSDGVRLFSPMKNDTLERSAPLVDALEDTPETALAKQWRSVVFGNPGTYLALRAELFGWVFVSNNTELCHPYHVGEEGDPADLKALAMRPRMDRRDLALEKYGDALVGTPVFSHPAYAALALLVLVALLRRRLPADLAMAGLLASVLLFTASFFAISIACDYRYLYVLDLSALAAALYVLADYPWQTKKGA